ncbi:hypothetical protein [Streptomyces sp. NPDC055099]
MTQDLTELGRVGGVLNQALALLVGEQNRLEQQYGKRYGDSVAGSPGQTVHGIGELSGGVRDALGRVALAAGYTALGLDEQAERAIRTARLKPVGVPSGLDRMARPLGDATVRALEMIRDLDEFFGGNVGLAIDVALAAPQATYPPDDWTTYDRQRINRPD